MFARIPSLSAACLLVAALGTRASAQWPIQDGFPGYAQNPNWLYDWIRGVGSVTFDADSPGFVHLLLDGPGAGGTYHNAEIYQGLTHVPPYCDFEVRLRNSNNNGFDADGTPIEPLDPLAGIGSRGWGLWNRVMDPSSGNVNQIWFSSISPQSEGDFPGRRAWVIRNNVPVVIHDLAVDLTEWHTYRIKWRQDYIGIYIDDMNNPIAEVTNPAQIPNVAMTFTMWIDNYVITGDFYDPVIGYLPVPDFQQYIDVDYVKVYLVGGTGDLDRDGDVDGIDFLTFSGCFNGSFRPPKPGCANPEADIDEDTDVDGHDFLDFSLCFNGSLRPPKCP